MRCIYFLPNGLAQPENDTLKSMQMDRNTLYSFWLLCDNWMILR